MSNKLIDLNALSSYKTQSDLKYQDKLTAGTGISIDANNVISATGGGGGSFAWTLIDTKTGTTAISLPSSFNELLIICVVNNLHMSMNIPYQALGSTAFYWVMAGSQFSTGSQFIGNNLYQAAYSINLNKVTLYRAGSQSEYTSSAVTSVYYR